MPKIVTPNGNVEVVNAALSIDLERYYTDAWDRLSPTAQRFFMLNVMQAVDEAITKQFDTLDAKQCKSL